MVKKFNGFLIDGPGVGHAIQLCSSLDVDVIHLLAKNIQNLKTAQKQTHKNSHTICRKQSTFFHHVL